MLPNYSPASFIPERAEGSRLWDKDNKEYIDFGGGIAVNSLGHSHPELVKALADQSKKIWHFFIFNRSWGVDDVRFIKIDVEGMEKEVT